MRFTLRLASSTPLPTALLARAEACASRAARRRSPGRAAAAGPLALPARGRDVSLPSRPASRASGWRAARSRPRPHAPAPCWGWRARPNGRQVGWRLDWDSRRHHVFLAGASGCGKSTAELRLALDDLEDERMVVLIDPHGDLAATLAPAAGSERVSVLDPRRRDTPARPARPRSPRRARTSRARSPRSGRWSSRARSSIAACPSHCARSPRAPAIHRRRCSSSSASSPSGVPRRVDRLAPRARCAARRSTRPPRGAPSRPVDSSTVTRLACKLSALTEAPPHGRPPRRRTAAGDDAPSSTAR